MSARTLRKANIAEMAKSKNPDFPPGATCRYCGKTDWVFYSTFETNFSAIGTRANAVFTRFQGNCEVRCVCGRKACLDNMSYLKTLKTFSYIQQREANQL